MKTTLWILVLLATTCAGFGQQNEVISGHLAVGNQAQIDGDGVDHSVIYVKETRTDTDKNVIGLTCITIWNPSTNPPSQRGVGCFDALTIAGPDTGQTITYNSNFSANSQGVVGKTGTVTEQWGYFAEQPLMNSVNVGANYGVHVKDQGANSNGSGAIGYGCGICLEPQTQDGLIVKGGRNSLAGTFGLPPTIISANHAANREAVMLVSAYSNDVVIPLPPASSDFGRIYVVKRVDTTSHILTLSGNGSDLIDGVSSRYLNGNQALWIISGATGWYIIANYP